MTGVNHPAGACFQIKVDGVVRTHRDVREIAIEAARELHRRDAYAKIEVTDLRDGSTVVRTSLRARGGKDGDCCRERLRPVAPV